MFFAILNSVNDRRQKQLQKQIDGVISLTARGFGYVTAPELEQDIEIEPESLNTALNGDRVLVSLLSRKRDKRQQGKVVRIIRRARMQFVGVLIKEDGYYLLKPDNKKMYSNILIPERSLKNVTIKPDSKALVRIVRWENSKKNPEGEIVRILGPKGAHEVEMQAVVLEHGFDTTFPEEVIQEAKNIGKDKVIPESETRKRKDFRSVTTFTIDPSDAKDFDDALSFQRLENGNIEVGIHIADVSYYVRPGTAIDTEAQERGTSIYLVDRTIPMLPHVLSDDVCSLNPNKDKLTYSAVFELDENANVLKYWFGATIIHSDKRFSYTEAQQILNEGKGLFFEELNILNTLAEKLRNRRFSEGSISFEQDEVKFVLDKNGKPIKVTRKERLPTMMLIEDFMLLANREVAGNFHKVCKQAGLSEAIFVYRVHDVPDMDKIEELGIFLRAIGYDFETQGGEIGAKEINKLFRQVEGKPEEHLIKTATIRSMAKAVYSTKNIGHFGLAFRYYTHFTSPIRRYPDLMVHRMMKNYLAGKLPSKKEYQRYERLAIQSSQREMDAVEAERDSIKYKQVEFMKEKIGEIFEGIVSGVVNWGLYIEEQTTMAEGLVRIRNLKDDFYTLDEKHYQLVGQKTKKTYQLGDKMKVRLITANLEDRTLEWELVV